MNAVDTNVYVDALDADEPTKQAKAVDQLDRLMLKPAETIILWQVACDFPAQLRKWESKGKITESAVESAFQMFLAMFRVRPPHQSVFQNSFDLRSRFSLSHWDSLLLGACKEAGVTILYSEDMASGTNYDGLAIVNPFA